MNIFDETLLRIKYEYIHFLLSDMKKRYGKIHPIINMRLSIREKDFEKINELEKHYDVSVYGEKISDTNNYKIEVKNITEDIRLKEKYIRKGLNIKAKDKKRDITCAEMDEIKVKILNIINANKVNKKKMKHFVEFLLHKENSNANKCSLIGALATCIVAVGTLLIPTFLDLETQYDQLKQTVKENQYIIDGCKDILVSYDGQIECEVNEGNYESDKDNVKYSVYRKCTSKYKEYSMLKIKLIKCSKSTIDICGSGLGDIKILGDIKECFSEINNGYEYRMEYSSEQVKKDFEVEIPIDKVFFITEYNDKIPGTLFLRLNTKESVQKEFMTRNKSESINTLMINCKRDICICFIVFIIVFIIEILIIRYIAYVCPLDSDSKYLIEKDCYKIIIEALEGETNNSICSHTLT